MFGEVPQSAAVVLALNLKVQGGWPQTSHQAFRRTDMHTDPSSNWPPGNAHRLEGL